MRHTNGGRTPRGRTERFVSPSVAAFVGRRFLITGERVTFRVIKVVESEGLLCGRRGQRASVLPARLLREALASGAVRDVTDGRECPSCGGNMTRETGVRVEERTDRTVNGYFVRGESVTTTRTSPAAWFCSGCEHVEEER